MKHLPNNSQCAVSVGSSLATIITVQSDGGGAAIPSCPGATARCHQFDPALVLGATGYGICLQ